MSQEASGNIKGLSPSDKKKLSRLFERKLQNDEIISLEFAREIHRVAKDLNRRVGALVTREGEVVEVFVGTHGLLYLPDLGRYRLGPARLRRLRLIFSDLSKGDGPTIPHDIYTDLEKLRLDLVCAVKETGNLTGVAYAHFGLDSDRALTVVTERCKDLSRLNVDLIELCRELEADLDSAVKTHSSDNRVRAMLIGVYSKRDDGRSSFSELRELAKTAGLNIVLDVIQRRDIDPRTLLGKGKLEEVILAALRVGADLLVFDGELKPSQWRAITNATELKVIDRSMLILDIFSQRAQSSEGRLQVELAQLRYNLPRLVEKDAGLSRLTGGIGGRGPGETKLEIGRRRIRDRIVELEKRIDAISAQRELKRKRRKLNQVPLISILGYTNVGKSTLFNALTQSSVLVENKLFATLDPSQRKLTLPLTATHPELTQVILSDTVGFIRDLPKELFNAFRATLEELKEATVLVHVIDATDPDLGERYRAVEEILAQMEIGELPKLIVLNKTDKVAPEVCEGLVMEYQAIPVSAIKRLGFTELLEAIRSALILNKPCVNDF